MNGGYAYKTCECEDFPCCGHNDVDPGWEPDPVDFYDSPEAQRAEAEWEIALDWAYSLCRKQTCDGLPDGEHADHCPDVEMERTNDVPLMVKEAMSR